MKKIYTAESSYNSFDKAIPILKCDNGLVKPDYRRSLHIRIENYDNSIYKSLSTSKNNDITKLKELLETNISFD